MTKSFNQRRMRVMIRRVKRIGIHLREILRVDTCKRFAKIIAQLRNRVA